MTKSRALGLLLLFVLAGLGAMRLTPPPAKPQIDDAGKLGQVRVYAADSDAVDLLFLFSDEHGWTAQLDGAARHLASSGLTVVGVDARAWLAAKDREEKNCLYLVADVENYSRDLQKKLGNASYNSPLVAGVGLGATVAYGLMTQSPPLAIEGAVALKFTAVARTRLPFCAPAPRAEPTPAGFRYGPKTNENDWWLMGGRGPAHGRLHAIAAASPHNGYVQVNTAQSLGEQLRHLVEIGRDLAEQSGRDLADLPVVEVADGHASDLLVIVYSGDGGWRDLDQDIARYFVASGAAVVGVDTLRYFWTYVPPEKISADLTRIIDHYVDLWNRKRVVLVGFSFGADVMPFAVSRLSPETLAKLSRVSLLSVEKQVDFEVHMEGWFGEVKTGRSQPIIPEIAKLPAGLVQCVYGVEDGPDSACPELDTSRYDVIQLPGGHHFDRNYEKLAARILDGLLPPKS